ncbi:hypothetical protein R1sor_014686 [Riccia sorocarpa]|uniref:Uncharacterized protein n=1 Tax=Riccia sorocarpa TaxID=122646 RepID=A0ABD3HD33_9MARC
MEVEEHKGTHSEVRAPEVEIAGVNGEFHPEVTSPGSKEKFVDHIKEKLALVKEKIIGHAYTPPQSPAKAKTPHGDRQEFEVAPPSAASSSHEAHTPRGAGVSRPAFDDADIPEGGLVMTAAPEEPEPPEEHHHGLKEKIKQVLDFPVPDTTVTPTKDFDETVPPNLKRLELSVCLPDMAERIRLKEPRGVFCPSWS